jgi:hypothetical protein
MEHTLSLSNKDVWEFYNKYDHLNFEQINVAFVNILQQLFETSNPSLNASVASQLIDNMKLLQTQVSSVTEMFSKSTQDINTFFTLRFVEFKKDYIEDLKMILSNNTSDKLAPIIREYNDTLLDKTRIFMSEAIPKSHESFSKEIESTLKSLHSSIHQDTSEFMKSTINKDTLETFVNSIEEKFSKTILGSQTIFNSLISSSESRLDTKLSELRDISRTNNSSQDILQANITELLKKMENSTSKGKISENLLYNVLLTLYPTAQIDSVGTIKETGDFIMTRKDKPTILFENKNYDKNVIQEEVKKFLRDVDQQRCCGIMLAQHYGITNKDNFEIEMHNGNVLVYLHKVEYDADKIKTAVDIIDSFMSTLESESEDASDKLAINKDVLDDINKEYQHFILSKLSHIKTIKDFQQKLIAQAEDFKLPNLEEYLSKLYASSSSKNDVCEYCNYVAKNTRALVAHYRGCTLKKESAAPARSSSARALAPPHQNTIIVNTKK